MENSEESQLVPMRAPEMPTKEEKEIQRKVPTIDLVDISAEVFPFKVQKRQFAPEYSYSSYISMLR